MRAFVLKETADILKLTVPLQLSELPVPELYENEILIEVAACGVCHTELDKIEGSKVLKFV